MTASIDVIVRTMADRGRAASLFAALDSIQSQTGVVARPIVVVNGQRANDGVLAALAERSGISVHRIPEASAAYARWEGRTRVTAPYFGYLDDDDTLIKATLKPALDLIDAAPACDVLVSNGYFMSRNRSPVKFTHMEYHEHDPARGLLRESWLQPGAFVCRTATVGRSLVGSDWNNMEWTRLAFELCAANKNIVFVDMPTVCYNDTPDSLSKQRAQGEASVRLWRCVGADMRFARDVRDGAKANHARALHSMAWQCWLDGDRRRAWSYHIASLRSRQAFKYLAFTRKLLVRNAAMIAANPTVPGSGSS